MDSANKEKSTHSADLEFFKSIRSKKTLTAEEWNRVAEALQNGSSEERNEAALVLKKRIAVPIVLKVLRDHRIAETVFEANYHTPDTYRDDLINEAWDEAFFKAKQFDPTKGASLQSYLYKYVFGIVQKRFYETVMQGRKPHYEKDASGKYHVAVTSTHSLSDVVRMKNKDTNKRLEDMVTNPAEEIRNTVNSNPEILAKLIVYAKKELTPPLFHMFIVYLKGNRNTIELDKLDVISRQRFYSLLKKIKRDFMRGGKNGKRKT